MSAVRSLNPIINKIQAISAVPSLCKVARFRQSECRKCEEICPETAITVAMGPKINGDCTHCGLCLNACPTETFYSDLHLDELLAGRMKALSSQKGSAAKPALISFHCRETTAPDMESLGLLCLGNLTENALLRGALLGFDRVVFSRGKCSDCPMSRGGKLFDALLVTMRPMAEALGAAGFAFQVRDEPKKPNEEQLKLSRRALFTGWVEHIADRVARADPCQEGKAAGLSGHSIESQDQKRLSPKREALRAMLRSRASGPGTDMSGTPAVPWKKMTVDQDHCVACGICVAVCPTGALVKITAHEQVVRTINHALCTNCLLCQEACPQQVIHFTENARLAEVVEDQIVEVARIALTPCVICGEPITPAEGGRACMTCSKRQMSWPIP